LSGLLRLLPGQRIREPRLYTTGHTSPQPVLRSLEAVEWRPAQRLPPYRPRRKRGDAGQQERLFDQEGDASVR